MEQIIEVVSRNVNKAPSIDFMQVIAYKDKKEFRHITCFQEVTLSVLPKGMTVKRMQDNIKYLYNNGKHCGVFAHNISIPDAADPIVQEWGTIVIWNTHECKFDSAIVQSYTLSKDDDLRRLGQRSTPIVRLRIGASLVAIVSAHGHCLRPEKNKLLFDNILAQLNSLPCPAILACDANNVDFAPRDMLLHPNNSAITHIDRGANNKPYRLDYIAFRGLNCNKLTVRGIKINSRGEYDIGDAAHDHAILAAEFMM